MLNDMYSRKMPDILETISNISNSEVFTPPSVANRMLDIFPAEIWSNPDIKILDPCCKSGVFLRECAKRLMIGLSDIIPNEDERRYHILKNMLYGIAITELTALMSRRTLYCSKDCLSKESIIKFDDNCGNIVYDNIEHTFDSKGKCIYCGASQSQFNKENRDKHAYQFIHQEEIFNMKFDVIIGNPPYQISTNSSNRAQATPIYHKFVENAIKLNPQYISFIIPARWFVGGFGLDSFRDKMLNEQRLDVIHDYINAEECFPGVAIEGGVCYFLWNRSSISAKCEIISHNKGDVISCKRLLREENFNVFIRCSQSFSILQKVMDKKENSFSTIVSPRDPFGLNYIDESGKERVFKEFEKDKKKTNTPIYVQGWKKSGIPHVSLNKITTRFEYISKYKIFISKAYGWNGNLPCQVINQPFIGGVGDCCSMTYLMVGGYKERQTVENVLSYMKTRFFRFLVYLLKNTQNASQKVYSFVPVQDFNEEWTDEKLYKKYGITKDEQKFIESIVKEMK